MHINSNAIIDIIRNQTTVFDNNGLFEILSFYHDVKSFGDSAVTFSCQGFRLNLARDRGTLFASIAKDELDCIWIPLTKFSTDAEKLLEIRDSDAIVLEEVGKFVLSHHTEINSWLDSYDISSYLDISRIGTTKP